MTTFRVFCSYQDCPAHGPIREVIATGDTFDADDPLRLCACGRLYDVIYDSGDGETVDHVEMERPVREEEGGATVAVLEVAPNAAEAVATALAGLDAETATVADVIGVVRAALSGA